MSRCRTWTAREQNRRMFEDREEEAGQLEQRYTRGDIKQECFNSSCEIIPCPGLELVRHVYANNGCFCEKVSLPDVTFC